MCCKPLQVTLEMLVCPEKQEPQYPGGGVLIRAVKEASIQGWGTGGRTVQVSERIQRQRPRLD